MRFRILRPMFFYPSPNLPQSAGFMWSVLDLSNINYCDLKCPLKCHKGQFGPKVKNDQELLCTALVHCIIETHFCFVQIFQVKKPYFMWSVEKCVDLTEKVMKLEIDWMTKMVFKAMTSVLVASVFNLVINVTNLSGEGESFESILIEIKHKLHS